MQTKNSKPSTVSTVNDIDLFGEEQNVTLKNGKRKLNPMIVAFGKGPENTRCKSCAHLYYKQFSSRYYKCRFRGDTNGPATDHKSNWPACAKFKEEEK